MRLGTWRSCAKHTHTVCSCFLSSRNFFIYFQPNDTEEVPLKVLVFLWLYENHKDGWWERDPKRWGGLTLTAYPEASSFCCQRTDPDGANLRAAVGNFLLFIGCFAYKGHPQWSLADNTTWWCCITGGLSQNTLLKIEPIQGWFIFGPAHSCWSGHSSVPLWHYAMLAFCWVNKPLLF